MGDHVIKLGINGFGRIGKIVFSMALGDKSVKVVAINDPFMTIDQIVYTLQHDTVHGNLVKGLSRGKHYKGRWSFNPEKTIKKDSDNKIYVEKWESYVKVLSIKEPKEIPWSEEEVDYVVEATGVFTSKESASNHLSSKETKGVIITAPSSSAPMYVMGVNNEEYKTNENVVSNASCTTNCLAPLVHVINKEFGIIEGLMTTVHAVTATQKVIDGVSKSDNRLNRCGFQNIIPAKTGAAEAVGKIIPSLNGKLSGMAMRVPISDVSVVDLTCKLKKSVSLDEILIKVKKYSENEMCGYLTWTDEDVVSSDFIGSTFSSIYDSKASMVLNSRNGEKGDFLKLISWYDNEVGYSARVIDLIKYINERNCKE